MVHVSKKKVEEDIMLAMSDQLLSRVTRANTKKESAALVRELLGSEERILIAKRIMVIVMLEYGYGSRSIADTLKVSTSTINRLKIDRLNGRFERLIQLIRDEKNPLVRESLLDELKELFLSSLTVSSKRRWKFINKLLKNSRP
jgi:uncharacterized protein YerC